jgi:hypothetical protein
VARLGTIGNGASMDSVLRLLRADHPVAIVDTMCMGPKTLRGEYGMGAIPFLVVHEA